MAGEGKGRPPNISGRDFNATLRRNSNKASKVDPQDTGKDEKQVRLSITSNPGDMRSGRRDSGIKQNDGLKNERSFRKSGDDQVQLSLQSLSEYQTQIGVRKTHENNASIRRRGTITETSITDVSTESGSRDRSMAMPMSLRALRITRRLSMASFTKNPFTDTGPVSTNVHYENNYKMAAEESQRFNVGQAKKIMGHMLEIALKGETYNPQDAARLCCSVSNNIKNSLRIEQNIPRYKIICHVTIGQKVGQEVRVASRAIWDHERDNYACTTYENESLFAVAVTFGVYFE